MLKLTTLVDIFYLYVQLLELHWQKHIKIEIFVTKCASKWPDKERCMFRNRDISYEIH